MSDCDKLLASARSDWDKQVTKWGKSPNMCPCGVPNLECANYKAYGYNCMGVRYVGSSGPNYKGFQIASFGFGRQGCPLPIGPEKPINEKI